MQTRSGRVLKKTSPRSGRVLNKTAPRSTQFSNLPLNVQRKIFLSAAASGPMQESAISQISKTARDALKYKTAARKIDWARRKMLTSANAFWRYQTNNIPNKLGKMAVRMPYRSSVARFYTEREARKKNFKNRILPRGHNNINNNTGTRSFYNNRFTYDLNRNGILRIRSSYTGPHGIQHLEKYIGKIKN